MNIIVNGNKISIEKNINLENFLKLNNINNKNIVIEVNKIIITKSMWKEKKIKEGDVIEIITAVGGG
ncbi:MAG: sulfur carrier protein ThiS [Gammaproteobacteria bacterium]|nr:sulfur carrier protein ThiS [Gammaproteobacteria bacterium]